MTTVTNTVTVDDLLRLGSDARVEVVRGELITMTPTGGRHVLVVDNLYRLLYPTISQGKLGYLFTDNLLYVLSGDAQQVRVARSPDVSFIHRDDLVPRWDIDRPYPGAPTLAVEVMSPEDQFEDVVQKIGDYFEAGTREVWVAVPRPEVIYRYRVGDSQVQTYAAGDVLDAAPLLPGLRIPLAAAFALPDLD